MQHQHLPQLENAVVRNHYDRNARHGNMYKAPYENDQPSALLPPKRTFKSCAISEYFIGALKIAYQPSCPGKGDTRQAHTPKYSPNL